MHFVPRWYLARWAVEGKVLVRRRDGGMFEANPRNVAAEAGMYDLPTPEGGHSTAIEEALQVIEDIALRAFEKIGATGSPPDPGTDERGVVSAFLAIQMTRTPEQRERAAFPTRVAEYAAGGEITREIVAAFLESVHLREPPSDSEVEGAYMFATGAGDPPMDPRAETIALMFIATPELIQAFDGMHWRIETDRKRRLITSDSPLVLWRRPTTRDKHEGIGVRNAEEIRFPLDPGTLLVLSQKPKARTARMSGERARACVADAAAACYQFIVGSPHQQPAIERLRLNPHRPVLRFNVAPGFQEGPDGQLEPIGDIFHSWVPRR
jgi:hypothetical protein